MDFFTFVKNLWVRKKYSHVFNKIEKLNFKTSLKTEMIQKFFVFDPNMFGDKNIEQLVAIHGLFLLGRCEVSGTRSLLFNLNPPK